MASNNLRDLCQNLNDSVNLKQIPLYTKQMMVVKSSNGSKASMILCEKQGAIWQKTPTSLFRVVIGENGLAAIGKKKEGDLKTPAGIYPIGEAFGSDPLALKLDYKYITIDDKFIDDVTSNDYNTWVTGLTNAKSYEPMLIKSYQYGAVINYNTNPVIAGAGSAIFIHLWKSPNTPTFGCIAMDEKHLLEMLHWLDKKQHPYIMIG